MSGGTSASKTISILLCLIDYAQVEKNLVISIVSESIPHLRKGAMADFMRIMKSHGYWNESSWNATNSVYMFPTGTYIEFFGADQPAKVHGPRRDILFVNEANNIPLETFTQLEIRTRRTVWLDWNPTNEFWWYTDIVPYQDVDFLILTYKDNEALSPEEVQALEVHKNNPNKAQWWKVYGEGQLGESEGRIYTGWNIIDELPLEARLDGYGLDFGYTNDPTAGIANYRWNGAFVLDEIIYQKGLSNRQIADVFLNISRELIVADSAEPKSIDELKAYGLDVVPTLKGQGSVLQGIQFVQDQKIFITKRSTNIIKEYRNYLWIKDKDGRQINQPSPIMNHAMDAIRYAMSKNFVELEPKPVYHPVNVEKVRMAGAVSDYGGVNWDGLERRQN